MMAFATTMHTDLYQKAQLCDKWSFSSAYSAIRKPIQNSIHSASQSLGGYLELRLIDEFNM